MTEPRLSSRHSHCELQYLYAVSELAEQQSHSLPHLLESLGDLLARSWRFPDRCHVRITLPKDRYETDAFRETNWRQAAPIRVQGRVEGRVEVFCKRPDVTDGRFLRNGRCFIDSVACQIGRAAERQLLAEELQATRERLCEAKAALRGMLSQMDDEKAEHARSIRANVEKALLPQLRAMARKSSPNQKQALALLEKGLIELADPFLQRVSSVCDRLTPAEIEICDLIRRGLSTKEIAQVRHVTPATVFKQRESIRRKLSIAGTDANLTAYLLAVPDSRNNA